MNRKLKSKIKKLTAVVFLTLLIWVWAYQALEKNVSVPGVLTLPGAAVQDQLVTFNGKSQFSIEEIKLKGSSAKINELLKKIQTGSENLEFVFIPDTTKKDELTFSLDLTDYIKSSEKIGQIGLNVVSVTPASVEVTVEKLVKQRLSVQCLDENMVALKTEQIQPERVEMFVRKTTTPETLKANVILTKTQIDAARKDFIQTQATVQIAPGVFRTLAESIKVKLPSQELALKDNPIIPQRIGYIISPVLQQKYTVELLNESVLTSTLTLKATDEALSAFEKQVFQILIEVQDADADEVGKTIIRDIRYNLPEPYFSNGQIKLVKPPEKAKFKLKALPNTNNTP